MALSKFTETLIRGFQTSPAGAAAHHAVGLRINQAIDVFDAINADKSRTKRGLGLGLSLVRAVLFAHGIGIDVESVPGAGSGPSTSTGNSRFFSSPRYFVRAVSSWPM